MTEPNIHPNHRNILEAYIEWFVTPPNDRLPDEKTQCMIADKLNINRKTLHMWERMPYFVERVTKVSSLDLPVKTMRVKQALYEKAVDGDVAAMKLYKEWLEKINDAIDINGTVEVNLKKLIEAENEK